MNEAACPLQYIFPNSSDLDVGRRPQLKSDETYDANGIVIFIEI